MEITTPHFPNTPLNGRILWYDGSSSVDQHTIQKLVKEAKLSEHIFVQQITPEIEQFNKLVPADDRILTKTELGEITTDWTIPDEYQHINVGEYVLKALENTGITNVDYMISAIERVKTELALYEQLKLLGVLRTLIYIINTLQTNKIVWGVGRGSSVSSYVLYLIGVHDVDSIEYELDFTDFLRVT